MTTSFVALTATMVHAAPPSSNSSPAITAPATAPSSQPMPIDWGLGPDARSGDYAKLWPAEREKASAQLESGDPAQIAQAVADVSDLAGRMWPYREQPVQLLIKHKLYDQAAQLAAELVLLDPAPASYLIRGEKLRCQALQAQGRSAEALSAARSYYDVAPLKDSADAILLVATCLAEARPDDPDAAVRFKQQQLAGATVQQASTTPSPDAAAHTEAAPNKIAQNTTPLGDSILAGIPPDDGPYKGFADQIVPTVHREFMAKGHLLLLEGRAKEAQALFRQARAAASDEKHEAEAIEAIAESIRDEAGCVGPANAFVVQERQKQQQ